MEQQFVIMLNQWANSQPVIGTSAALLAQWGIVVPLVVLAGMWFWPGAGRPARQEAVLAGAAALALAFALSYVLEHSLARPRPFVVLPIHALLPHAANSSFPSDHSLYGAALVGPLLWRLPRLGVWPFLWVLLVGLARVAVGIHYPSDIVGSAFLAALPAAVGLWAVPWVYSIPPLRTLIRRVGGVAPQ